MIPAICNGKTYNMVIVKLELEPISETLQVWCDGMTLGPPAGDGHLSHEIS